MDYNMLGLPRWLSGREFVCQYKRLEFDPWVRKTLQRRKWQSTSVVLPGESCGQRRFVDYGAWSHTEMVMTERLSARIAHS